MAEIKLQAFVDRFEEDFAVLLLVEEGREILWPADHLPEGATEGDVISVHLTIDVAATRNTQDLISSLIDRLERREQ